MASSQQNQDNGRQLGWAVAAAVAAGLMVMKPWGVLTAGEWRWVLGGLGVVMLWRLWGLLRSSSSSGGRVLMWLVVLGLAGSVGVVGIPTSWMRVPAWSEVTSVVLPLMLGLGACVAVVMGIAGLNRHRELRGTTQRSYVPIVLNLTILVAVWQVVRQPLWEESMRGMMALPQLGSQRQALEESLAPWVEQIQRGTSGTAPEEVAAVSLPEATALRPRKSSPGPVSGRRAAAPADEEMNGTTPKDSAEWIRAAIHNPHDPILEWRAASALVAEGREDAAIRRLAAARDRGCQSAELIRFHAQLLKDAGRIAAAAATYEALVLSAPGTEQDLHEALNAWESAGQPDRAESLAERLRIRRPTRELLRWMATHYAKKAGGYDRALELLGQLSRRSPFDPADAIQCAEVALKAGRPEIALDALALLEQHGENSPKIRQLTARARASSFVESSPKPPTRPGNQAGG